MSHRNSSWDGSTQRVWGGPIRVHRAFPKGPSACARAVRHAAAACALGVLVAAPFFLSGCSGGLIGAILGPFLGDDDGGGSVLETTAQVRAARSRVAAAGLADPPAADELEAMGFPADFEEGLIEGEGTVEFILTGPDGGESEVVLEYRPEGEDDFREASAPGGGTAKGRFQSSRSGTVNQLAWDTERDLGGVRAEVEVRVRVGNNPSRAEKRIVDNTPRPRIRLLAVEPADPRQLGINGATGPFLGKIRVRFELIDAQDPPRTANLLARFLDDSGTADLSPSPLGEGLKGLSASPSGEAHVFVWESEVERPNQRTLGTLKLRPYITKPGDAVSVAIEINNTVPDLFLITPSGGQSGRVPVRFRVQDANGDPYVVLGMKYSLLGPAGDFDSFPSSATEALSFPNETWEFTGSGFVRRALDPGDRLRTIVWNSHYDLDTNPPPFTPPATARAVVAVRILDLATNTPVEAQTGEFFLSEALVSSYAGGGVGDGLAPVDSVLLNPTGLVFDSTGALLVADTSHHRVRRLSIVDGRLLMESVAGNGFAGFTADLLPARDSSMNAPKGLAMDPDDNLYVADSGNNLVRRVDREKGIIQTVAGVPPGEGGGAGVLPPPEDDPGPRRATSEPLSNPSGVALDGEGLLWIADTGNGRILLVDPEENIVVGEILGLTDPEGIATGPGGVLALADSGANTLVIGPRNAFLDLATRSGQDGQIDNGVVARRLVLGGAGAGEAPDSPFDVFQGSIPLAGGGSVPLDTPRAVTFDGGGNLYLANSGRNQVLRRDAATGEFTIVFPPEVTPPDCESICLQADEAYLACLENQRSCAECLKLRDQILGDCLDACPEPPQPCPEPPPDCEIICGEANAEFQNCLNQDRPFDECVQLRDELAGPCAPQCPPIIPIVREGPGQGGGAGGGLLDVVLSNPSGLAVDDDGNLVIASTGDPGDPPIDIESVLVRVTGDTVEVVAGNGEVRLSGKLNDQLAGCTGDRFRVGRKPEQVGVLDAEGAATELPLLRPRDIDRAPDGTLYIVESLEPRLRVVDPANGLARVIEIPDAVKLWGVAVDRDGRVYISDEAAGRVRRIDPETGATDGGFDFTTLLGKALSRPRDVAIDRARGTEGTLYIADTGNGRVIEIDIASGTPRTVAFNFRMLYALAVDTEGRLYVAADVSASDVGLDPEALFVPGDPENLDPAAEPEDLRIRRYTFTDGAPPFLRDIIQGFRFEQCADPLNVDVFDLRHVGALAVDELGDLYVADTIRRRILRFRKSEYLGRSCFPPAPGSCDQVPFDLVAGGDIGTVAEDRLPPRRTRLNRVTSMLFDEDRNLYLSDHVDNRVRRFWVEP